MSFNLAENNYDEHTIIHRYCLRNGKQDVIENKNQEISGIDCMLCTSLWEDSYKTPEHSKLKKLKYPKNTLNPDLFGLLEVYYNPKEMNLCFDTGKDYGDIDSYYSEGRVDFFYDSEGYLLDVRIKDLST